MSRLSLWVGCLTSANFLRFFLQMPHSFRFNWSFLFFAMWWVTQFHHICFFCAQRGIVEKLEHGHWSWYSCLYKIYVANAPLVCWWQPWRNLQDRKVFDLTERSHWLIGKMPLYSFVRDFQSNTHPRHPCGTNCFHPHNYLCQFKKSLWWQSFIDIVSWR